MKEVVEDGAFGAFHEFGLNGENFGDLIGNLGREGALEERVETGVF